LQQKVGTGGIVHYNGQAIFCLNCPAFAKGFGGHSIFSKFCALRKIAKIGGAVYCAIIGLIPLQIFQPYQEKFRFSSKSCRKHKLRLIKSLRSSFLILAYCLAGSIILAYTRILQSSQYLCYG
jgi:hypothetical protein